MPDQVTEKVLAVIAEIKRLPKDSVSLDSSFQALGIDSLDGMNILFAVETEFDISIPDEQVPEIKSVRQMVEGIEKLLAEKTAS